MTIKDTIRAWLGLDTLPSVEMYKAMELKQKQRHDEILTLLHAIETRVTNARPVKQRSSGVPIVDWEEFQRMALKQLEEENKEN